MAVHQVLVAAAPGDAVTGSALEHRSLLRRSDPSEIYARYVHPDLGGDVRPLEDYARREAKRPDDRLLFHASIGDQAVFEFLDGQPEELLVAYHNVAPADLFEPWDPRFAALLRGGRRQIAALAPRASLALADSAYNAAELVDMGYRDVRVSPLVVDLPAAASRPDAGGGPPTVLYVGQLLPHKRIELLVMTAHVLATFLRSDVRIVVVGMPRLPAYRDTIAAFVHELRLPLEFTGWLPSDQIAARYAEADVFFTASEHEGFCVPVLEAMANSVPVVARACAALPETIGAAGVVVPADAGATVLAEAVAMVLDDSTVRSSLVAAGEARLRDFDPEHARATFLGHLGLDG